MIAIKCPKCQKLLRVRPEMAGKAARCPGCQQAFAVPAPRPANSPANSPASSSASKPAGPVILPDDPDDYVSELDVVESPPAPPPRALRASTSQAVTAKPPDEVEDDEPIEADVEEEDDTESTSTGPAKPRRRRRRKRRASEDENPLLENFRYYTAAFGILPWIVGATLLIWIFLLGVSLLLPPVVFLAMVLGFVVYMTGWVWLVITAFRDDTFQGMLVVFLKIYGLVYIFLNLNETWKPAVLLFLGLFMEVASFVFSLFLFRNA